MINWKKAIGLGAAFAMLIPLAACGNDSSDSSSSSSSGTTDVTLTVWAPSEDQSQDDGDWLGTMEKAFEEAHPEYKITWKNDVVSEGDAAQQVKTDPSAAADVYMFANDQLGTLIDLGAIGQLSSSAEEQVKEQNSQSMIDSVTSTDGKLYGVPYTGNTWFMYYNTAKYSDEDIKSLDTLLEKGKVTFPITNSWYMPAFYAGDGASFFGSTGTDVKDGISLGKDAAAVTEYLVNLNNNANFTNDDDTSGLALLKSGDADVYFSGTWSSADVKEALGDNYGAAQLPTYTLNGESKQLEAFAGSKAIAYNPNASNTKAAAEFAAFLGSTEAQKKHWELRQIIPTDKTLTDLDGMADDPSVAAQIDTINNTSIVQPTISAMSVWWDPCKSMGDGIVNGDVTLDNAAQKTTDWQNQIDTALQSYQTDSES